MHKRQHLPTCFPHCIAIHCLKNQHEVTSQSQTLNDLAFSKRPETIIKSGVDHVGMSDHSLIYIHRKISIPRKQSKIINTRQFGRYDLRI